MTKTRTVLALAATAALLAPTGAVAKPHHASKPKKPDLAVVDVAVSGTTATPGEALTVTATVANQGKAKAKAATVTYYLTRNDFHAAGDVARATSAVANLKPRKKKPSGPVTVTVPPGTVPGGYHVVACVSGKSTGTKPAAKANDCRPSATVAISDVLKGTLSGTITVAKGFSRDESGNGTISTESSTDTFAVNLGVDVDESRTGDWKQLLAGSSSYSYNGTYDKVNQDRFCRTEVEETASGGGAIVQNGDRYYDTMYADFARTDHSQIRVLVQLPFETKGTKKTTSQDPWYGCESGTTTTGPSRGLAVASLELTETSRTAGSITYRVTDAVGSESSRIWKSWDGTATLTLR